MKALLQLFLALLIQCSLSWASYPPMVPTLQPYQAVSPQGMWRISVKPGNREGAGAAETSLTNTKTGEIAWKRMLPYTFWQCCVNEDGIVGGYAYTKGVMGEGDQTKDAGHFVISILDVKGESMHEEQTHRAPSSVGMGYYQPKHWAERLCLDGENDRMILVMPNGMLRTYDMNTGAPEVAFVPESKGDASGYVGPDEIRFVSNTRLILIQSNTAYGNATETTVRSCIQLIDGIGRTVWATSQNKIFGAEKEWPYPKYHILDPKPPLDENVETKPAADDDPFAEAERVAKTNDFAEAAPFAETNDIPEAQSPPAPREVATFAVYFGDTEEEAVFRILDSSGNGDHSGYRVVEISREKSKLPEQVLDEEEAKPPGDFPVAVARKLADFQLKQPDGTNLTKIIAAALGPDGSIYVLDGKTSKIHIYGKDGKFLRSMDTGKNHTVATNRYTSCIAVDAKGEVFVRISDGYGDAENKKDPFAGLYLRFAADGTLSEKPLDPPSRETSGHIVVQPSSNNLLSFGFGHKVIITRRDEHGSRAATLTHRADGHWLESIQSVACAPDGTIAVRDSSKGDSFGGFTTPFSRLPNHLPADTVTIYEADGDPIRTLDFSGFAGLDEIAFDGIHIVSVFPYDPPTPLIYVFDAKGTPVGAIRIEELAARESVDLRPFIDSGGEAILAIDLVSGMAFRYGMP